MVRLEMWTHIKLYVCTYNFGKNFGKNFGFYSQWEGSGEF